MLYDAIGKRLMQFGQIILHIGNSSYIPKS